MNLLKDEMNQFTIQLNDRNTQIKHLTEKVKFLESTVKEKDELLEKKNQELVVCIFIRNTLQSNEFTKLSDLKDDSGTLGST